MSEKKKKTPAPETAQPEEEACTVPEEETTADTDTEPETPQPDALQETEKKLQETTDRLMRTLAEYDNFRKRSQKEKEAIFADVKADTVGKLLPVADNLERAVAADGDAESYKKGVEMTLKQLSEILAALGVESFGAPGDPFDPNLHNGVMHVDDDALPENSVAEVFMKGYRLGDRVIRHATVKVAN